MRFHSRRLRCFLVSFVTAALSGCATNQVTGERHVVLTSAEQERESGLTQAKQVAEKIGLVNDPQVVSYVTTLGMRLVQDLASSDVVYTFQVADMPEPNAFALPGGFIYVSRGLLALVNSEDELVTVLGHEIGHVAAHHAARRAAVAAPWAIATGLTSFATGLVSPSLGKVVAGLGGLTGTLALAPYSREQEREADRLGMELAARGGWNPAALAKILKTMQDEERLHGGDAVARFSFLATHPTTAERVLDTAADAPRLNQGNHNPVAMNRAALLRHFDGLLVGSSPAAGVVVDGRFLHPDLDLAMDLPANWKVHNERTYVAAIAPEGHVAIVLHAVGGRGDLAAVVQKSARELGLDANSDFVSSSIHGQKAARVTTTARNADGDLVALDITYVAHRSGVFEIVGLSEPNSAEQYRPTFQAAAESLRPLSSEDRQLIHTTRLRLQTARYGDTIAALSARTGSVWSAEMVAVLNGIDAADRPLPEGFVVKIALDEPYLRNLPPKE